MKKLLLSKLFVFLFIIGAQAQLYVPIRATGGQITDTLDNGTVVTLNLSSDDAEQENDEVDSPYDDDLDAGWEGAPDDQNILTLGLRFTDITIDQGATIDSAFIIFHTHEGKLATDVADLDIVGEATDNALTFDSTNFNDMYLLTDRPATAASVNWLVDEEWVIWTAYRTPDISSIIQEIVNRPGWSNGNALALILKGKDQGPSTDENAREFTAFENISDPDDSDPQGNPGDGKNHPERVPYLAIYYNGLTGTGELAKQPINIFHNSFSNTIQISRPTANKAKVTVFDLLGNMVNQYTLSSGQAALPFSAKPGMYLVQLTENGKTFSEKIVVR